MIATLATVVTAALDRRGRSLPGATASAAATGAMLAVTLIGNLRLNKCTVDFPANGEPEAWQSIRRRR